MPYTLINKSAELKFYYQLHIDFRTIDSMGANFINSCLEIISKKFHELLTDSPMFKESEKKSK